MFKSLDHDAIEKEFKEATNRLEGLKDHLSGIDHEMALLTRLKDTLEENISILKSRQVITIAIMYKKVKDDLDKTYEKLNLLQIRQNNMNHSINQAIKLLAEHREKYLLSLDNKAPKVIEVDFRSNDDRQDGDPK